MICWNLPYKGHMNMVWLHFPVYADDSVIQILIHESLRIKRKEEGKLKVLPPFLHSLLLHSFTHSTFFLFVFTDHLLYVSHCVGHLRKNDTIRKKKHCTHSHDVCDLRGRQKKKKNTVTPMCFGEVSVFLHLRLIPDPTCQL